MAISKERIHRMNNSGSYDTIHHETDSDVVIVNTNTSGVSNDSLTKAIADIKTTNVNQGNDISTLKTAYGTTPIAVSSTSAMTDHSKIYVLTTNGNWYYYNGTSFVSGGTYQSTSLVTDKDLTTEDRAADGKATGNMIIVNDTQPSSSITSNKLWIKDNPEEEITVPTYEEFTNLENALITLTTPVPVEAVWSQGSISYASGVTITSSTRIRTNFIRVPIQLIVTVPSGMKISIRCYSTDDSSGYINSLSTDWLTGTVTFSGGYYYKVVASYTDDSNILPAVGSDVSIESMVATDTTLTKPNVAADAEITGIEIDEAKQLANAALNLNKINILPVNKFYQGSITYDTGQNMDSSTRVRAAGYFQFPKSALVKVVVKSGYKVVGRVFSGNPVTSSEASQVYVGDLPAGSPALLEDGFNFIPNEDYFYRFVIAYADDRDITPSDVLGEDALTLIYYTPMETSVTPITTLLGNVCIRAAKTYNFSDGTPPVVGWYLLQGTDNRFYKSVDLKSAQYLFTFSAPSSTVSNWSCGIDKDDNVIFTKDAAGYTDDDGPRLDDAKRVNPICFLASEQYETSHEIDFGSSFKPAGWISNVGWCMLPNGDVVFCEYTRGTLATCNVWRISGDVTNPANWEKTWSHAIVDSIAPDVAEMKHCHCVMYDFFTGIVYFGTGDGTNSSYIYHSTDNGATWTITYGPNRDRCRLVTIVFTKDYAYWASDSYEQADKHFFIATRDANGVIDVANATSIQIPAGNSQACYGCVLVKELNLIVMMDRADNRTSNPLTLRGYDLTTGTIVTLATIPVVGTGHVGFRTKYIEWYPTENCIPIGFNPRTGGSTRDTNENAVCGNLGGTTGDGSTRINNLLMYLYKPDGEHFDIRFGTVPLK